MSLSPEEHMAALLPKLRSERITYFPIRHHSPSCAAHLQRWIEVHNPASVLVEGPGSFTSLIPLLVHDECICPVAIYTNFVDKQQQLASGLPEEVLMRRLSPPRFAAYYPFCDYSPEFVALRTGHRHGARLSFIDLEYAEMVLGDDRAMSRKESIRVDSLSDDPHLRQSEYAKVLGERLGCRDFNELWDHLFESQWDSDDTDAFIDRVATWCAMARSEYTEEHLHRDGTIAREACMAAAIQKELKLNAKEKREGPVLVVTGGFHTVALPDLVAARVKRPKAIKVGKEETGTWLMRYSFDHMDALTGYAAGMPGPAFYDRMWQATKQSESPAAARATAGVELMVEIGRLSRARDLPTMISTPDAIAAVEMTRQLAHLRGHPWPMREDVLDGMRSCFIKGEVEVEGRMLMRLVREVLAGGRVGQVPPETGTPPIVESFHKEARRHRLPTDTTKKRDLTLDLYRKSAHREISRMLHRLMHLQIPYGFYQNGPDFVRGIGMERIQELWQVAWTPGTDSSLIEASVYGPTVEEAAMAKLREQIAQLEDNGQGRSTASAVAMLVQACRMGLHEQAGSMIPLIDQHIAEDPNLASVVTGLSQLELLHHSREPLEATRLTAVPELMTAAYHRACRLQADVATCPDEVVEALLRAMCSLREIVSSSEAEMDATLFHQALERVIEHPPHQAQAAMVGAAAGVLFGEGLLPEPELMRITSGFLGGTASEPKKTCGILRGLLATAREVAWQVKSLIEAIDQQFDSWDENDFLKALPDLRLAFADLTPKEITRVADHVVGMHDGPPMGSLVHMDLDESEVQLALEITRLTRESLQADGITRSGGA